MELELSLAGRRYGYRRDPMDARDYMVGFDSRTSATPGDLDLEPWCGPVFDQGQQGSCTANAGAGNAEWLVRKFPELITGLEGLAPETVIFSRAYLYYAERLFDGDPTEDGGSTGRTSCRVMNGKSPDVKLGGLCLESSFPYNDQVYDVAPPDPAVQEAKRFQFGAYHRLSGFNDAITCLNSGYPFLLGFAVYQSFESDGVAHTGVVPMPDTQNESMLGGHEVLVIGHSTVDNGSWPANHFKVRNSWGSSWGDKGNFYLPDTFLANPDLAWDMWMQHLGAAWVSGKV